MGKHIPVLLNECIEFLNIRDGGTYVDFTLGRGGHSSEILKRIPHGRLIAFDLDPIAIKEAGERLSQIGSNFTLVRSNFSEAKQKLLELGINQVDGILADLGVSSPQLDEAERGFSYKADAKLDMRMDPDQPFTAYDVVNGYGEKELADVIFAFGEDKDARRIAKSIVKARSVKPIETTFELVEAIKAAKSAKDLSKKGHPAKQTFQAIRMEVNGETKSLKKALEDAPGLLAPKGRLAIISFMSLDDREIKNAFRSLTVKEGSRHDYSLPDEGELDYVQITKKPIVPSDRELEENHRAISAKLRVIERK